MANACRHDTARCSTGSGWRCARSRGGTRAWSELAEPGRLLAQVYALSHGKAVRSRSAARKQTGAGSATLPAGGPLLPKSSRRNRAFDPGAGVGDGGFDLGQIVDAEEFELRLASAGEVGAHLGQGIILHGAGAQVEVIFGLVQHGVAGGDAGVVVQALRQELRDAAEAVAEVGDECGTVLIEQRRQHRTAQRVDDVRGAEQPVCAEAHQRRGVDLGERIEQRRV